MTNITLNKEVPNMEKNVIKKIIEAQSETFVLNPGFFLSNNSH